MTDDYFYFPVEKMQTEIKPVAEDEPCESRMEVKPYVRFRLTERNYLCRLCGGPGAQHFYAVDPRSTIQLCAKCVDEINNGGSK